MDLIKKSLLAVILLLVVAVAWVGFTIYFKSTATDVNPNASSYTRQLKTSFDDESLQDVSERTESSFPVSPSEFLNLANSSN